MESEGGPMLKSCVDCKSCSPNYGKRLLKCKREVWEDTWKGKKTIRLTPLECKTGEIAWRKTFKLAEGCKGFVGMG